MTKRLIQFIVSSNKEIIESYGVDPVDVREFEARLSLKADAVEIQKIDNQKAEFDAFMKLKSFWEYTKRHQDQLLLVLIDNYRICIIV